MVRLPMTAARLEAAMCASRPRRVEQRDRDSLICIPPTCANNVRNLLAYQARLEVAPSSLVRSTAEVAFQQIYVSPGMASTIPPPKIQLIGPDWGQSRILLLPEKTWDSGLAMSGGTDKAVL